VFHIGGCHGLMSYGQRRDSTRLLGNGESSDIDFELHLSGPLERKVSEDALGAIEASVFLTLAVGKGSRYIMYLSKFKKIAQSNKIVNSIMVLSVGCSQQRPSEP
jgi:hypothetical protein